MLAKALLLLGVASADLLAAVSWDGYIFRIECGTATLKYGSEFLFICDRSEVKVIGNHLIVDDYGRERVDLEITDATALAIVHEFRRDTDARRREREERREWRERERARHPENPETEPPTKPTSKTLPASRSF